MKKRVVGLILLMSNVVTLTTLPINSDQAWQEYLKAKQAAQAKAQAAKKSAQRIGQRFEEGAKSIGKSFSEGAKKIKFW